jgi:hypothetical protein
MKFGIATALLLSLTTVSAAIQPQQPEKGSIEGIVVSAATGAPIEGAEVQLGFWTQNVDAGMDAALRFSGVDAITGKDGRFSIKDRFTSDYRVVAKAEGYVQQDYGQKVAYGMGTPVRVGGGVTVKDIVIRLPQASVIKGRVADESRQPVVGIRVELLRPVYSAQGRTLQTVSDTTSDDRGEYRLFGIAPGRYYLGAGTATQVPLMAMMSGGAAVTYANVYYPGVDDLNAAVLVEAKAAFETTAELMVKLAQLYHVRGRVLDSTTGQPPATLNLSLTQRSSAGNNLSFTVPPSYDAATGVFELPRVLPGSYGLTASRRPPGPTGQASLTVRNENVDNVQIVLSTGTTLSAKIALDGGQIPSYFGFRFRLTPVFGDARPLEVEPQIAEDGLFSLPNVRSGEYLIDVGRMASGFSVKSIRYAGIDVLGQPLRFSETDSGILEVVVRRSTAQVSGSVTDSAMRGAPQAQVVLVPEQRSRGDLYRLDLTDPAGNFSFERVVPGQYKVFSWDAFESGAYFNPDFVARYEQQGRLVTVSETSSPDVQVKLIAVEP